MRRSHRLAPPPRPLRSLSLAAALVATLAPAAAGARELVVAADGSGTHRTIGEAVAVAASGDTIRVTRGVYRETVKMRAPRVTLAGEEAVLDGQGGDGVWPSSGSTVRGLVIVNCDDGIFVTRGVRGVRLEHLTIAFNRGQAIALMEGASGAAIRNNVLWRNGDGLFNQGRNAVAADHNLVAGSAARDYHHVASGAGDVAADPLLAGPERGDFRLAGASPARGRATDGGDLGAPFAGDPLPVAAGVPAGGPAARPAEPRGGAVIGVLRGGGEDDDDDDGGGGGGGGRPPANPPPGPPATPRPHTGQTLVVAQDGSGSHLTIGEAVAFARPGDRILVKAGVYRETVNLKTEGLILEGEGAVIDGGGQDGVWPSSGTTVRGFVIVSCDDAIFVTSGTRDVLIERVTIVKNTGQAIVLMNNLGPVTIRHTIMWANGDGIYNQGGNAIDAHHNLVFANDSEQYYMIDPGAGDLQVDPRLEAPDAGDFRLRADSPARGAGQGGVDLGAPVRAASAWRPGAAAGGGGGAGIGAPVPAPVPAPAPAPPRVEGSSGAAGPPRLSVEVAFAEPGGDGRLAPGETGTLSVTVRNAGGEVAGASGPGGLSLRVALAGAPRGVALDVREATLGLLRPAQAASATFRVAAAANARVGRRSATARLTVLLPDGKALPAVTLEIPLGK